MAEAPPSFGRKSSAPWDRLKPVKQDPLESVGFVSKGDTRLLDPKSQESYYDKIVARYMQFCSRHSKDLDAAFASLSLNEEPSLSSAAVGYQANRLLATIDVHSISNETTAAQPRDPRGQQSVLPAPSTELSTILTALRKLREGLLASSKTATSTVFSQRVHVFNIRLALLALHPPSYHPSLLHLLFTLHSPQHPLPQSELIEMMSYLILDLAIRQGDLRNAYALRYDAQKKFGFSSRNVDTILKAVVTGDWISFWRVRRKVDGYIRAVLHWHVEALRKLVLKTISRSYMTCDIPWILKSAAGDELGWEELVEAENIGWQKEGDRAIIRKPKSKPGS